MSALSEQHKDLLDNIYYSSNGTQGAFSSLIPLYTQAKKRNKKITIKIVKQYLLGNSSYLLHRRVVRKHERRSFLPIAPNDTWSLDYAVYLKDKGSNNSRVYSLNCLDVFSRIAWARAGTHKTAEQTLQNFKEIITESKAVPKHLFTDQGNACIGMS